MTSNIINKEIDVVHLRSDSDLVLETNTQIKLSTNNILINYIPFDEYIRNVVFDTAITSSDLSSKIHNTWTSNVAGDDTKINLTNNTSELVVDEVHTSGIFSTHSHINSNIHFINLSAANNVQLSNLSNSSNIIYNFQGTAYSLSNYIYNIINNPDSHTPVTLNSNNAPAGTRTGIDTLGIYIGNKILTNKLTTTDVMIGGSEPILELNSATAINFMTDVYSTEGDINAGSNILFGSLSLDSLVKSQLDETGQIIIGATMSSGQNIGMTLTSLTHSNGYSFTYDVVFYLYEHNDDFDTMLFPGSVSRIEYTITIPVVSVPLNLDLGNFTELDAGKFYTVLGTFTNTRTGTVVENIEVTGGQNIATIMNIVIISAVVKNESTITILFRPHNTVVADWTSSGEQIKFSAGIENGDTGINYGVVDTGERQDMSMSPPDDLTYDLSLSSISYGNGNILRVETLEDGSKRTTAHRINIISNHVNPGSSFEMSQNLDLTPFTFSAPSNAPILSINYLSKQLTWTHTNDLANRLNTITFELFHEATSKQDNSSMSYSIDTSSVGTCVGTWKVRAKNVYGQVSKYSSPQNIVSPSFNVGSITHNGDQTFDIPITGVKANGSHTLSGSGSYLITTSSSSKIVTNTLNPGTYNFTVTLTDQLGLSINKYPSQLSINSPYINSNSIGPLIFSGQKLEYYVTVSVSNPNVSWSIIDSNGSVNGTDIYYTFPANDTGGPKSVYVKIEDLYGYTAQKTANVTLTVSFTGSATNLPVRINGTTISFTPDVTPPDTLDLASYKWYLNNSQISGATSSDFEMTASNFGNIHCEATQTNAQGFTRTITSVITDNTEPTISNESFIGINLSENPIYQFSRSLGSNTTEVSVVMNPETFNGVGKYTLTGTYANTPYELQKEITIGTFTATAPTTPSITSATSVSYDSMTINYSLGNNGNPSVTPTTITLFYGTSSGSESNHKSLSGTSTNVSNLLVGTRYYFKIEKVYEHYGTISSSNFDETTLDYQYDFDLITTDEYMIARTNTIDNISVLGMSSGTLREYGNTSFPINHAIKVESDVEYGGMVRTGTDTSNRFTTTYYDQTRVFQFIKSSGNNVYRIKINGLYLRGNDNKTLSYEANADANCDILMEPTLFSHYSHEMYDGQYHDPVIHNYNDNENTFGPASVGGLVLEYFQGYTFKFVSINRYLYLDSHPYYPTIGIDPDTTYNISVFMTNLDNFKRYQWFVFKVLTTEYLEQIRYSVNFNKINMIFEEVYLRISATTHLDNIKYTIGFDNRVSHSIAYNYEKKIGPINLYDIIGINGINSRYNGSPYIVLLIKNIFEWVNSSNLTLGRFLSNNIITNSTNIKIEIELLDFDVFNSIYVVQIRLVNNGSQIFVANSSNNYYDNKIYNYGPTYIAW